ncbi:MAG: CdaR family protein [Clostridium sp.]|uniref:CdaR family protein n=1 Tax=Clostridium sp. TaxID=1506 RepID=UPI002FC63400
MVQKDNQKVAAIAISIFLALLLWIYVMGEQNPVQTRSVDNVRVSLENTENITRNNLVLLPRQDFTVSIEVKGRLKDLVVARGEDIKLEANITGDLKKGENEVKVSVKSLPRGLSIEGEIPTIVVNLDNLSTKYVPVKLQVVGDAKQGYEYIKPTTKQTGVTVSGAKSYLEDVTHVVGKINISGQDKMITKTVPLEAVTSDDKVINSVTVEPKFIDVDVEIAPFKEVPVNVKTKGSLPNGLEMEGIIPKLSTVKIIGEKSIIDKITSIGTEVFDISNITSSITKEIKLKIPSGVSTKSEIKSVGVEFKIKASFIKDFVVDINVTGRKEGYEYTLSESTASLKINGEEKIVNSLILEDIYTYVDVSSLSEGEHTVEVKVRLKDTIGLSSKNPGSITVKVKKN